MPCRFCNAQTVTKEHGWPQWIRRAVPSPPKRVAHVTRGETVAPRRRLGPSFDSVIRCACADCNNGWMASLEDETKPILLPLIVGETRTLDDAEQELLARWALKTAMVVEFVHPKGLAIPASDRHHLREGRLPRYAQIWVARYRGTNNAFYYHDQHRVPSPDKAGRLLVYTVTLGAGQVLFHICVPAKADRQVVEHVGALGAPLHQIHPSLSAVTVGPDALDDDGLAWLVASQRTPIPSS